MYQESGVGDGVLHLIDHLIDYRELLLGHGQGVRQGTDDVEEAWDESAVEVTHPQQALEVQLGRGRGNCLMEVHGDLVITGL